MYPYKSAVESVTTSELKSALMCVRVCLHLLHKQSLVHIISVTSVTRV